VAKITVVQQRRRKQLETAVPGERNVRCSFFAAARLDRITRRAHTLSQLLEDGYSVRAADMPGADDLMMRVYAAMAQKERELISERTKAALAAAKARGAVLGGDRGYRPLAGSCAQRRPAGHLRQSPVPFLFPLQLPRDRHE